MIPSISIKTSLTLLAAACLICASPRFAHAGVDSYDVFSLRPALDGSPYFAVYGSDTHDRLRFSGQMFLDWQHEPLMLRRTGVTVRSIVGNFLTMYAGGAFGILDWFQVGVGLPVVFYNKFTDPVTAVSETKMSLGDPELNFKFRILDRSKYIFGLAVVPFVRFPLGDSRVFAGTGSFSGGGTVVGDFAYKRFRGALNFGVLGKKKVERAGTEQGTSFMLGAAGQVRIIRDLFFMAELTATTLVNDFFGMKTEVPVNAHGGLRYVFTNGIDIQAGGGAGLIRGVGAPEWRAFMGAGYSNKFTPAYDLRDKGMSVFELPVEKLGMSVFDLAETCPPPEVFVAGVDLPECHKFYELLLNCPPPDQFVLGRDPDECQKVYELGELIKGEWSVVYLRDEEPFVRTQNIEFAFGSARLTPHAKEILDEISIMLLGQTSIRGLITEGHTDNIGSDAFNLALSKARAESVRKYLVQQGLGGFMLVTRGMGEGKPIDTNATEAGRAKNRRVQFIIITEGTPIQPAAAPGPQAAPAAMAPPPAEPEVPGKETEAPGPAVEKIKKRSPRHWE